MNAKDLTPEQAHQFAALNSGLSALFPTATELLEAHGVETTVMALLHLAGQIAAQTGIARPRMDYLYDTAMIGGRITVERARGPAQ